jgi:5-methylcytosine-specific restriction endonuclease McrA
LAQVNEQTYYLDHIEPRAKNGTNFKNNLVTSCQTCNSNKTDNGFEEFLLENYRKGLLKQNEYQKQLQYIKVIIESGTGEP